MNIRGAIIFPTILSRFEIWFLRGRERNRLRFFLVTNIWIQDGGSKLSLEEIA
jgi:hypothetical protein